MLQMNEMRILRRITKNNRNYALGRNTCNREYRLMGDGQKSRTNNSEDCSGEIMVGRRNKVDEEEEDETLMLCHFFLCTCIFNFIPFIYINMAYRQDISTRIRKRVLEITMPFYYSRKFP